MVDPIQESATVLLARVRAGDATAPTQLFELLYGELRQRAQRIAGQRQGTLQPTAIVHEAWLRLIQDRSPTFTDRQHFLRAAAAAMRCVLVDHVRARATDKRGGTATRIELDTAVLAFTERAGSLLDLDQALRRLEERDPQLARLVELRFFAGLEMQEVADALAVSLSTVERGWRTARAFLHGELAR